MIAERKPAETQDLPQFSYEYFARSKNPQTGELVAFEPVNPIFEQGIIKFVLGDVVHDVGAGTGRSTENYRKFIPGQLLPSIASVASEPSEQSLAELKRRLGDNVETLQLDALDAVQAVRANKVFLFHAIHLLSPEQRKQFLDLLIWNLPDDGVFALATSFIQEDVDKQEAEVLINPWMKQLYRRELVKRGVDAKRIIRDVTKSKLDMWSAQQYIDLVRDRLDIVYQSLNPMYCGLESYEGINRYQLWIDRLVPGVDPVIASEALNASLHTAWKAIGRDENSVSRRNTLVIVGRKTPEASRQI